MDLKPPYFYLWGYLKDYVYVNNPQTIGELKAAITAKIREIPKEECVRIPFRAHWRWDVVSLT
jgi:hypothetical protein